MRRPVAVLALGAVGLFGCGNGSDKPSANGGSGTTDNGSSNGSNGGSNGGGTGFSELLAKAKAAKYKITYTSGGGDVFTLAQDPPLFAYTTEGSATYVTADGAAVSCSGSGSSPTCTKLPGKGDTYRASLSNVLGAAGALFLGAAGSSIPGLLDIKTSDDKIAGRDAVCATIDGSTLGALGNAIQGSYSVCVDKEVGVMLRVTSDDGSGSSNDITATAFEEPSDADFIPPATPDTVAGQ
jgi:hypothetical protein